MTFSVGLPTRDVLNHNGFNRLCKVNDNKKPQPTLLTHSDYLNKTNINEGD